jgi:hypothetical protein
MGLVTSGFQSTVKAFPMATMNFTAQIKDSLGCVSLPAIATVSAFICAGVEGDETSNASVYIYPNPVKDLIRIQLPYIPSDPLKVYILNILGQCVRETSLESSTLELNVSDLEKGIYFLKVTSNKSSTTTRFLKE